METGIKGRKPADLAGRKFGRLTAEYPTMRRDGKGSVYWHCRCDCGGETDVPADGLMTGHNRSCGCLKRENQAVLFQRLHQVDGTCVEWLENRKYRSDNTSGFRGVTRLKSGKYRASIGFKGERFYLGTYADLEEAVNVRLQAEQDIHEAFLEKYRDWVQKTGEDPEWGKENPFVFRVEKKPGGYTVFL